MGNPTQSKSIYEVKGTLKDSISEQLVSSAIIELWAKGTTYNYMIKKTESRADGEFCFVLKEEDLDALKNDLPLIEGMSGSGPQIVMCGEEGPELFFRIFYQGEFHKNYVEVENSDKPISHTFQLADDNIEVEVTFNASGLAAPTSYISARLIDESTQVPYPGETVKVELLIDDELYSIVTEQTTDGQGYFSFSASQTEDLIIAVRNSQNKEIKVQYSVIKDNTVIDTYEQLAYPEENFDPYIVQNIPVTIPAIEDESENITDLASEIGLTLSSAVLTYMTTNNLEKLSDIRRFGYMDDKAFAAVPDQNAVKRLNKHAELSVAENDAKLRDYYITETAGKYDSLYKIAKATRSEFVSTGSSYSEATTFEKARFHRVAQGQQKALNNILTQARIGSRYVKNNAYFNGLLKQEHPPYCKCEDCQAAVSPLAYLADLLKYATEHIKKEGNFVSIQELEDLFYQPFGELPADCDEMDKKICQYRIAIDILRAYHADLLDDEDSAHPTSCQEENLVRKEKEYRDTAYFTLLELIGTSYNEIRNANATPFEEREEKLKPLTNRLGITFEYYSSTESITGASTASNYFDITGDQALADLILEAGIIRVTSSTNNDGIYHIESVSVDDPSLGNLRVTVSEEPISNTVDGNIEIFVDTIQRLFIDPESEGVSEEKLELIFGLRDSDRLPLDDTQPEAEVLQWKRNYFREVWDNEDHDSDPYTKRELPIIDPDIIGPDDFRLPSYGNGGPIDLWKERKDWIENNVLGYILQAEDNYTPKGVQLGDRLFSVSGDITTELLLFSKIKVTDSTDNNGVYTIVQFYYDSGDSETKIKVKEAIPSDVTIDGDISYVKNLDIISITTGIGISSITVDGDISSEISNKLIVKRSNDIDGIYTISSVSYNGGSDETTININEEIAATSSAPYGEIQFEKNIVIADISIAGKQFAIVDDVTGDFSGTDPVSITISGSSRNNGNYTVGNQGSDINEVNGCTTFIVEETIFDSTENGSLSYEKTLTITGIGLGAKTFIVKDVDLSLVVLDNDPFEVFGSTNNDDSYTTNGNAVYDGFDTRITVDEIIKGEEANGSIELTLNIDDITGNVITVNNRKLDHIITDGDTISVIHAGNTLSLVVDGPVTYSSGDSIITVEDVQTAVTNDDLVVTFSVGEVDISGKYFEVNGDFTEQILVGYKITFEDIHDPYVDPGNPGNLNNKEYEVIQVTYSDTSDKSKVFVKEYIDNNTITDIEPDTGNDQTFTFNRVVLINVQSPEPFEVLEEMSTNAALQNGDTQLPWILSGWTDWANTPGWTGNIDVKEHFSLIEDELKRGVNLELHTKQLKEKLNLSVEAFLELVRILKKHYFSWDNTVNEKVNAEEWQDFFNILVQAVKENKKADWIYEEANEIDIDPSGDVRRITLDPRDFWISLREPEESKGIYPRKYWTSLSSPTNWFFEQLVEKPLIDPDIISLNKLPEVTAGVDATALYNARKDELDKLKNFFQNGGIEGGISAYIKFMFGSLMEFDEPLYDILELNNELNSIEQEVASEAERKITVDLGISLQEFSFTVNILNKNSTIPNYTGTPEEQNFGLKLLLRVYKEKRLYPYWAAEERTNSDFSQINYTVYDPTPLFPTSGDEIKLSFIRQYSLLKATLPKWRATSAQRTQWQNALKRRSRIPIVDPDIVRPEDFKTYDSTEEGYNAFQLWQERKNELQTVLTDMQTTSDTDIEIVTLIDSFLGLPAGGFDFIADQEEAGIDISKRLDQIKLTLPAYRRLAALKKVAELPNADDLLESEKLEIYNILIHSGKRRMYAAWNDEEVNHDAPINIPPKITLSQDFFKAPPSQYANYPELIKQLPKWRATFQERQEWVRTLQGRIENVEKAEAVHADIVHKTEERTLRILRDALIQTVGDENKFLDENAEMLTTRFLFDFKVNCCQNTTRVSQAIETLQQLHWTERTGVLEESGLDIDLIAPDFDEEWKWIGSYANWRAAMFVFLFPENLLYPTLRSHQSPAFRKLTENLRGSNRITPETACKAAKEYSDYFEDVSKLQIEATCNTKTLVFNGNCDNHFVKNYRCLFYAFARGKKTNKVYVSIGEVGGITSMFGQGFWTEVEGYGTNVV
ncbi:MAG: neuraminidase-like domain-containing protein [Bacteroidia bacterium]